MADTFCEVVKMLAKEVEKMPRSGFYKSFCPTFFKKWVAPTTQDATLPADKIRVGGKVCFFCTFLQSINKKLAAGGISS
jgi:hypothetical protein